jgi:hypothetical protein
MIDWLLSVLWYGSLLAGALGLLALVKPIRRIHLPTRPRGAVVLLSALALIVANAVTTPAHRTIDQPSTELDRITPSYHFREKHEQSVEAPPPRVLAAVKGVTAAEIALFQLFTRIRRFGRSGRESVLNAPEHEPILDVATRTGFVLLADTDREVVVGAIVAAPPGYTRSQSSRSARWFVEVADPGLVKATMNFRVEPESATRTRLTTETRVFSTDRSGARRFTPYWRTIFPGSWILRVTWLQAIARRAERGA